MEELKQILNTQILGSTVLQYVIAIFTYLGLLIALKIVERVIVRRIKKLTAGEKNYFGAFLVMNLEKIIIPTLYFASFYFSVRPLILDPNFANGLHSVWVIVLSFQATKLILSVSLYAVEEFWLRKQEKQEKAVAFKSIIGILRFAVWSMAVVFVLDNLGFNVSAVVAGLGIGGIAVALAAQTILGDLFNYFVIFFDRPFEEGDFIIFEDYMGTIEKIGVKSTRIRSLGGEQIVISNTNLTGTKIRNYKRMAERRVLFKLGLIYQTPAEKLKKVPGILRGIIESVPRTRVDRVHFKDFGDFSLNIEVVYYVLSADYNQYMDIQQQINFHILEGFQKEGLEFAYPTSLEYQKELSS